MALKIKIFTKTNKRLKSKNPTWPLWLKKLIRTVFIMIKSRKYISEKMTRINPTTFRYVVKKADSRFFYASLKV